jgi:hypothetical protein
MGRSKYLNPVYSALMISGQQALAITWNNENANFYSEIAENEILGIIYGNGVKRSRIR